MVEENNYKDKWQFALACLVQTHLLVMTISHSRKRSDHNCAACHCHIMWEIVLSICSSETKDQYFLWNVSPIYRSECQLPELLSQIAEGYYYTIIVTHRKPWAVLCPFIKQESCYRTRQKWTIPSHCY